MNSRGAQDQNKHNSKNQKKSLGRELCGYYCFGLQIRINSSKHLVTIQLSKSGSFFANKGSKAKGYLS